MTALNALPPAAVFTNFDWIGSTWRIRWNDPANPYGDISSMQVYIRNNAEGGWTLVGTYGYTGGVGREVTAAGRGWETLHHAFIRVINNAGYTDSNVGSQWTPPAPGTEKNIGPDEGNSFAMRGQRLARRRHCSSGHVLADPDGSSLRLFFYGSKLYDAGHGYPPVSGEIFMMRDGVQGFTGYCVLHRTRLRHEPSRGVRPATVMPVGLPRASSVGPARPLGAAACRCSGGHGFRRDEGCRHLHLLVFQSDYKVFLGPAHNGFAGVIGLRW